LLHQAHTCDAVERSGHYEGGAREASRPARKLAAKKVEDIDKSIEAGNTGKRGACEPNHTEIVKSTQRGADVAAAYIESEKKTGSFRGVHSMTASRGGQNPFLAQNRHGSRRLGEWHKQKPVRILR
jgi:hypothetical protein